MQLGQDLFALTHPCLLKTSVRAWSQWFTPVILATWESEIRGVVVQGQPEQMVHETPHLKNNQSKKD
jgi:hypothetical protein